MIGLLRFVGLMNAAVWFGSAVFFTFVIAPAAASPELRELLGTRNYPYFSGALLHIFIMRYFALHIVCSAVALAHLGAEWLYVSKPPGRWVSALLWALLLAGVLGHYGLEPRLARLHTVAHAVNVRPAQQQQAQASLATWRGVYQATNLVVLCGLAFYLWRVGHPSDSTRFVSPNKFRG